MADDAAEDAGRMALKGGRVVPTGSAIGGASGGGPSGGPAPVAPVVIGSATGKESDDGPHVPLVAAGSELPHTPEPSGGPMALK